MTHGIRNLFLNILVTTMMSVFSALALVSTSNAELKTTAAVPTFEDSITVLLHKPGVKYAYPRWSHDAKRIFYQSNEHGKWELWVLDVASKTSRVVFADSSNNNFLDWSPDNSWIAMVSDRTGNEELYTLPFGGGTPVMLAPSPAREIHPYVCPDNLSLLFNSTRDGYLQVYRVNRDGTGLTRLTTTTDDITCARMSPDMKSIVMLRAYLGVNDEVFSMNADGSGMHNVTNSLSAEGWPAWYPDGSRIIYSSDASGTFCVYSIKPDGSDRKQLSHAHSPWRDTRPSVSVDGTRILFNRQYGDETIAIVTMEAPDLKAN